MCIVFPSKRARNYHCTFTVKKVIIVHAYDIIARYIFDIMLPDLISLCRNKTFFSFDLKLWPLTLTYAYKFDLHQVKLKWHAKYLGASLQGHFVRHYGAYTATLQWCNVQEAQLSPSDHAMRRVNRNLANYHATVQKLLVRQVLNKSKLWS